MWVRIAEPLTKDEIKQIKQDVKEGKANRSPDGMVQYAYEWEKYSKDGKRMIGCGRLVHNEDGPAEMVKGGKGLWSIHGHQMTREQFNEWKKKNPKKEETAIA